VAIKFQYNKTSLQDLSKQLKVRERALPTIKNKESALRIEVKRAHDKVYELEQQIEKRLTAYSKMHALWGEFDMNLIAIENIVLSEKKIAGVRIPVLDSIEYRIAEFSMFNNPGWFVEGIAILKEMARIAIEREIYTRKTELLDYARKKTTQKVNLYEKVQIPGYHEAILKIKRFLEDEENLSKSAQKIVKNRQMEQEERS